MEWAAFGQSWQPVLRRQSACSLNYFGHLASLWPIGKNRGGGVAGLAQLENRTRNLRSARGQQSHGQTAFCEYQSDEWHFWSWPLPSHGSAWVMDDS